MPDARAGRLTAAAVTATVCAIAAWAVACGLPLSGLGIVPEGGTYSDAPPEGAEPIVDGGAPPCASIDAACLGTLPTGWQAIAVTDGGCDPGFTAATLVANPRVADGGCACGQCQVIGSFGCAGAVAVSGGDGCNDPTLVQAEAGVCTPASAQHVEAHPIQASGNVACYAANDAGAGATVDPLSVCIPGCGADYCASSSRCIFAEGALPCPAGFTLLSLAGTSAVPGCSPCSCDVGPPGACGGTVTVFEDDSCDDSGASATYAVGACNQFSTTDTYSSLRVDLVPPDASCSSPAAPESADASLVQVRTICCK